jgi:oxygen-dependent protoporphyrinogen oxidase
MSVGEVAVVGAGPSGLAAAYRLQEAGHRVRVFDRRDRPGGKMQTSYRDGFVIDEGPSIMPSGYASILGLARDAGMGADVMAGGSIFGFAGPKGLHYLDAEHLIRSGLTFNLLGPRSKLGLLRLTVDALRSRSKFSFEDLSTAAEYDFEDAATYGRRRADEDVMHYVVDSLLRTLVGASAEELSAVDFRFGFAKFIGSRYKVFREGMGSYAHHVAKHLTLQLECTVELVEQTAHQARVRWRDTAGNEHDERFDGCVIAADAKTMRRIYPGLDPARREFVDRLTYTTHVNVCAALSRAPRDVPAMAINVPESVHPGLIVIVLDHNKLASHAPAGKGLLSLFTSTGWSAQLRDQDDDVVINEVLEAAEWVLPGVRSTLEFASVHRWDPMLLQSYPGYYRGLRAFREQSGRHDRHVQLAGDYFCQGSVNAATAAGERAARDLHTVLAPPRASLTIGRPSR